MNPAAPQDEDSAGSGRPRGRRALPLVPILLAILALSDLRVELLLLADHFTFTTLTVAIRSHLLAVAVLLLQPSLWRLYRGSRAG
jgi:hypothetical protein